MDKRTAPPSYLAHISDSLQKPIGNLLFGCCYLIGVFAVGQFATKSFRGITNNREVITE